MNAHQRRVARREEAENFNAECAAADAVQWDDDDLADGDERAECTACGGDGCDPMTDYMLPCQVCGGDRYFD